MRENKTSPIILVTGANRGIGYEIIQKTAQRLPEATYILGCRSSKRGHEAVASLQKLGITAPLGVLELDVDDDNSICLAVSLLVKRFGRLDVLINAASITLPTEQHHQQITPAPSPKTPTKKSFFHHPSFSSSPKNSPHDQNPQPISQQDLSHLRTAYTQTLNTNLTSTSILCHAFLPLLESSILPLPRIINLSFPSGSSGSKDGEMPLTYRISKYAMEYFSTDLRDLWRGMCEVFVVRPGEGEGNRVEAIVRLVEAKEGEFSGAWGWEVGVEGKMREISL